MQKLAFYALTTCFLLLMQMLPSGTAAYAAPPKSKYRGWDYLANKLIADGIPAGTVRKIYSSKQMPVFTSVPFSLDPGESTRMYTQFATAKRINQALTYLKKYRAEFAAAEKQFGVDRHTIAAIMLIETQFGVYTGNSVVVDRLSRLANINDPANVRANTVRLQKEDRSVTLAAVAARARYLEKTFYPEIPALIEVAKRNNLNIFGIKGSFAGAFGLPQFLPSSYIRFGVDADRDGRVSLFTPADAIASTANYLGSYGWLPNSPREEKFKILWKYNKSKPYIEAVMQVAARLRSLDR